jgi:hypothetical protein
MEPLTEKEVKLQPLAVTGPEGRRQVGLVKALFEGPLDFRGEL